MKKLLYVLITLLIVNMLLIVNVNSTQVNKEIEETVNDKAEIKDLINNLTALRRQIMKSADNTPSISPIHYVDFYGVSSKFGMRYHPIYKREIFHSGVDIITIYGSGVYSTITGKVTEVVVSDTGYGNYIVVSNDLFNTKYAHLGEMYVYEGFKVNQGDLIAKVGDSGAITGIHLHYEVYNMGEVVNPLKYFYKYNNNSRFLVNND